MSDENKPMTKHELEALIVARCWKNDDFRHEFMADPKATFEKYTEHELPPEVKIVAHTETANEVHFVIPEKPKAADGVELSDDDLDKVAGGDIVIAPVGVTVALASLIGTLSGGLSAATTVSGVIVSTKEGGW